MKRVARSTLARASGAPRGLVGDARDPYRLDDSRAYERWRAWKLARAPAGADELVVDVADPLALEAGELAAMRERLAACNMVVYRGPAAVQGAEVPRRIGEQLGLESIDVNWLARADGVSVLRAGAEPGDRHDYIPYTDRPINWHTDGYYNPPARRILAMLLHCESTAAEGGANALVDHERAYIALRDLDPAHVRALSAADAMRIPERADATRPGAIAREAIAGPVFARTGDGELHMRYTARTRSIAWRDDDATRAAVAALAGILDDPAIGYQLRLSPGMGIVCNNVLHRRDGFVDRGAVARCVYRIRYRDRVPGTGSASAVPGDGTG